MTAAVLAPHGYSVLVLEKGQLVMPEEVDSLEQPAFTNLYEKSALLTNTTGDFGHSNFARRTSNFSDAILKL